MPRNTVRALGLLLVIGVMSAMPVQAASGKKATPEPPKPAATPLRKGKPAPTAVLAATRVPARPTPVPQSPPPEQAPTDPPPPAPEPPAPTPVTAAPQPPAVPAARPPAAPVRAVQPALPTPTPTQQPTVEPTVAIVDISQDPNAHLALTSVVRTPTSVPATAMPTPEPTAVVLTDQDVVGGVLTASMDPLVFGGRIGLLVGGAAAAGYFAIQRLRRR